MPPTNTQNEEIEREIYIYREIEREIYIERETGWGGYGEKLR